MPELRARALTKHFSGVIAVRNVDFTLRPGEIVGYLGPNGSGKTTTLRMVAGPGRSLVGTSRIRRSQRPRRSHRLPPRTRLRSGGTLPLPVPVGARVSRADRPPARHPDRLLTMKIDGFLELFGLTGAADQGIASYSKGMRQKIVISAALLHDPSLILFDEPESGLDVTTTLVLRHLIRLLAERGKAILYSSHILEVVERVCSRVIVLYRGAVVADDSVEHLQTLMSRTLARRSVLAARHQGGPGADRRRPRRRRRARQLDGAMPATSIHATAHPALSQAVPRKRSDCAGSRPRPAPRGGWRRAVLRDDDDDTLHVVRLQSAAAGHPAGWRLPR